MRIAYKPGVTSLKPSTKLRTMRMTIKAAQRPDRSRTMMLVAAETTDTVENSFLMFIVNLLLEVGGSLLIESAAVTTEDVIEVDESALGPTGMQRLRNDKERRLSSRLHALSALAPMLERLNEALDWLLCIRKSNILQVVLGRGVRPTVPSQKLLTSIGYSPLYFAYLRFEADREKYEGLVDSQVKKAIQDEQLRPVRDLYEMWIFLEVYYTLVSSFGFTATTASPSPLERCYEDDGVLSIPKGSEFFLEFAADGRDSPSLYATLTYDGRVNRTDSSGYYRPDVFLKVRTLDGKTASFAMDAKYRRYDAPLHGDYLKLANDHQLTSFFALDLLHTAKSKYYQQLNSTAAFILHSDARVPNYWGGDLVVRTFAGLDAPEVNEYPGHRFGAISVVPNKPQSLITLFECFLRYHLGSLSTCWTCRRTVLPTKNGRGVGDYYLCDVCTSFWIVSWCRLHGHRLVKLGTHSFHLTEDTPWKCKCPQCGDVL
jgi:hypothetical protein